MKEIDSMHYGTAYMTGYITIRYDMRADSLLHANTHDFFSFEICRQACSLSEYVYMFF